jgi:hypothetical protein
MKSRNVILAVLAVAIGATLFLSQREGTKVQSPATVTSPAPVPAPAVAPAERVPPFYLTAEAAQPYPRTLSPTLFAIPPVARAYEVARRIPGVLAQQPCYCWCDKFGHGSLLDCYSSDHGAG